MTSTPAERLQELIKVLQVKSVSAFAASIGVRSTVLANMLGGRMSKPSFDTLEKIKAQYPRVSLEWLVTGEGTPLKPSRPYATVAEDSSTAHEQPIPRLGKPDGTAPAPATLAQCQQELQECRKELELWKEKADTYRQLADDRQTIIELMKLQR